MPRTIGIDLGTTNSVVAFLDGDRVETIPNADGSKLTPSVVYYKDSDEVIVGELAKRQHVLHPKRVVRSVKRIIGKRRVDLGDATEDFSFQTTELDDGMAGVVIGEEFVMRPEEISADILERLRVTADDFLSDNITQAVITVPAHFNDQQRVATKAAAEMAGLEVLRIINEPTAAALAYGMGRDKDGRIAVFDFGGGTFDISVLQIMGDTFEVLSTNGDNHLGGDDIDQILFQELCDGVLQQTGIDPTLDPKALQRLREAAEKAKCELSSLVTTTISLPFIVADSSGPKHYQAEFTRDRFNELMAPIFERLFDPCQRALDDAHMRATDVDEVILVGGSTRIPMVQQMVAEFFGRKPNMSVNPDEAVAVGAAIQGAVITGDLREVLLLDVNPLTLGIELAGGIFKDLISRNSTIPCEASRKFTTVVDNQTSVLVHVLQGERRIASENHSLAKFRLVGLPPAPKELLEIEVKFSIDANGILSVSAMDLSTGQKTSIVVENYGNIGIREEEVKRALSDAEKNLAEDEKFVRFADRRSRAERLQKRADQLIEALGDLISEDHLRTLKESCLRLDLAMDARNETTMENEEDKIRELIKLYEHNKEIARVLARKLSADRDLASLDSELDSVFDLASHKVAYGQGEELELPSPKPAPPKPTPRIPVAPPPPSPPSPPPVKKGPAFTPASNRNQDAFAVPSLDSVDEEDSTTFDPSQLPPPPPA